MDNNNRTFVWDSHKYRSPTHSDDEIEEEIEEEGKKQETNKKDDKRPTSVSAQSYSDSDVEEDIQKESEFKINKKKDKNHTSARDSQKSHSRPYSDDESASDVSTESRSDKSYNQKGKDRISISALEKAFEQEKAKKKALLEEVKLKTELMSIIKTSLKDEQYKNTKLKRQISDVSKDHKEEKIRTRALKKELSTSSKDYISLQKRLERHDKLAVAIRTELKNSLTQAQAENLEKSSEIQALHGEIKKLQDEVKDKDSLLSSMQQKCNGYASGLQEEQQKNSQLQRDLEAAQFKLKKEAEDFDCSRKVGQSKLNELLELTSTLAAEQASRSGLWDKLHQGESHCQALQLQIRTLEEDNNAKHGLLCSKDATINKLLNDIVEEQVQLRKLRVDFYSAVTEKQNAKNKLQESRVSCGKLEEAILREQAQFHKVLDDIRVKDQQLIEKTIALEKSLLTEKLLTSSVKDEQERYERQTSEHQTASNLNCLRQEGLQFENESLRTKCKALMNDQEGLLSIYHYHANNHQELIDNKNAIISEQRHLIKALQGSVKELATLQSKSQANQTKLQDALEKEQEINRQFKLKADKMAYSLEEEKITSTKYCVELKELLCMQIKTMEQRGHLIAALQEARGTSTTLKIAQSRKFSDIPLQTDLKWSYKVY